MHRAGYAYYFTLKNLCRYHSVQFSFVSIRHVSGGPTRFPSLSFLGILSLFAAFGLKIAFVCDRTTCLWTNGFRLLKRCNTFSFKNSFRNSKAMKMNICRSIGTSYRVYPVAQRRTLKEPNPCNFSIVLINITLNLKISCQLSHSVHK
jgi:hypothetical protein